MLILVALYGYCTGLCADEIGSIKFDQLSDYKVPKELLLFNTQLRKGLEFDQNVLNEDIKRLYATGFFSDIVVETKKLPDGKLSIVFKLKAKTRIKTIKFEGNKKFDDKKLKENISLTAETPLNDEKLQQSTAGLRKFYRSEGYNEATVTPLVEQASEQGYVNIVFKIKENLRLKVDSVSFVGNTVFSSWTLRRSIETQHSYLSWLLDIGLYDRKELERDKLRLRELYWDKGYLDFKITEMDVKEDEADPEYVNVTFHIFEGKPYKINKIYVSGAIRYSERDILERLSMVHTGQVYDNRKIRDAVDMISNLYYPMGYADFVCKAVKSPDFETHTVDIDFQLKPGEVYRVRDINITGNRVTKDYVIRRELALQPGDLLDNQLVKVSKSRLMGLNYFKQVEAVSVNTEEKGFQDVDISVKEKDTIKFNIGAGWSDTDSLSGVVGFEQSNFDITDPFNYFQGGGQRLVIQGLFGLKEWGGFVGFSEPWLFGIPLRLDVTGYSRNRTYENWRENHLGFELSLTKKLFDDFTSLSLGYRFEGVRVYDMDNDMSEKFKKEEGTDLVGAVSFRANRDTRDSLSDPTSGYQVNLLSEFTSQAFGATHNYYRFEIKGIQYFSLLDDALIFHFGGKLGTVQNIDKDGPVPIYERYFLGGGDTIRGFPYRSIGPVDKNDDVLGGNSMLLFTAEMSHPIYEFIRGAVFVDAGGVFKESWDYSFDDFNVGVGYGLRIKIPQIHYPIRLDLAYPVLNNQKGLKSKLRFHFNVGFNW